MQSTEMELFNKAFDALGYQWSDSNRDKAFLGWELARKAQQPVAPQAGAPVLPPEDAPEHTVANTLDTTAGPEGEHWYCENHPDQLMGHSGCGGAGITAGARIPALRHWLRLARQEIREANRMRDEMASAARNASRPQAGAESYPLPVSLTFSARQELAKRHGTKVTPEFNDLVRDAIQSYLAIHAAALREDLAMDEDELKEVQRAISDFEDCGETDVDYRLLMRAANLGYLDCEKFTVTDSGQKALNAAMAAKGQEGGAA